MRRTLVLPLALLLLASNCARRLERVESAAGAANIHELWQAPDAARDLFHGPGGPALAPRDTSFAFVAEDGPGFSPGYDVRDSAGVVWSVKLGPESQTEVVTSRLLWAIGFHQPPTYYLSGWSLTGGKTAGQPAGRFRPTVPTVRGMLGREAPLQAQMPRACLSLTKL